MAATSELPQYTTEQSTAPNIRALSGLHWVIPEKIHTPTTEGMLENLTGGGVNGSGNSDVTVWPYKFFLGGYFHRYLDRSDR